MAQVRGAPFLLDAIRAADGLARSAARATSRRDLAVLIDATLDPDDQLTAIAGVQALGRVLDDGADEALSRLLADPRPFLREHAAAALVARPPRLDAIGPLVAMVATGDFAGMVAQRTLQRWARSAPDHVALALDGAHRQTGDPDVRARLVETLGVVPGRLAYGIVDRIALDLGEHVAVRTAAVAALGDRADDAARAVLSSIGGLGDPAAEDPEFQAVLRLARVDASGPATGPSGRDSRGSGSDGLAVAQMFLHADLDRELSRSGAGDNGGIATLLVRLGNALVRDEAVADVLTISRGTTASVGADLVDDEDHAGHRLAGIPLPATATGIADSWSARVAVERGLRRLVRHAGPLNAFHCRMADVGSMAAHTVCGEMGIPLVFTLAPDPHATVHGLDVSGALRRDNFGDADEREHYWFRIRLVQQLGDDASEIVLFPRPDLRHDLLELVGVDIAEEPSRYRVVPEGIDLEVSETARAAVAAGGDPAVADLEALIAALPPERHGLPLAISVGRLNRVKGTAGVVEAWAGDPDVRARCNLVIVGGDLDDPSPAEQEQIGLIAAVVDRDPAAADGLVLAGHRPNDVVARWLAATHLGTDPAGGGLVGPRGVYVCGSLKEEFGIALLEALAAGLVVVAPADGGPPTFVEPGVTGVLIDTRSPREVATGIAAALDMAQRPDSADRARATVRDRFTIDTMAAALADVYRSLTSPVPG